MQLIDIQYNINEKKHPVKAFFFVFLLYVIFF
jgi:hypothetical protein